MKHLCPFNALVIVALLLVGLTTPTFGQGPLPQGEPPAADEAVVIPPGADLSQHPPVATPEPPPTKEPPPFSLGTVPAEPADAGVTGGCEIMALWPGPDGYGYIGQTVTYNWVEISGSGTAVYLSDDNYNGPFPIGFTFNFYGTNWTQFYIGSNGFISLGGGSSDLGNDCPLPNANTPNNIIALMWDDLDPGDTSDPVYYQSFGTCPIGSGACLVVQYENFHHYPGDGTIAGTFEAILFDNGDVIIQFQDAGAEEGSGSTTGIENADAAADYGLTYACDTSGSLGDNLAIWFGFPTGLYLSPSELEVTGCAGLSQSHTFTLMNFTGDDTTFDLDYDVPSGNASISGPASLTLNDGEEQDFDVELTPNACLPEGAQVIATIEASGNGYNATSVITKTITTQGFWDFRAAMLSAPSGRGDHAVVHGGDGGLYAIGGTVAGVAPGNGENERYDIATDSWTARSPMPTPLTIIDGGQIDGVIYIPGGYDGINFANTHQAYDTATNSWSNVAAAPRAVAAYAVAACGGLLYRVGGAIFANWPNADTGAEVYDPVANGWTTLASMNHGHLWHAMECINGKLYVAGGLDENGNDSTVAEVYDIAAGTWSDADMADLPVTWWGATDFRKHDQLYIASGIVGGSPSADVIIYAPDSDTWDHGPSLQDARFRLEGDYAMDSGYAVGGWEPIWTSHDSNEYLIQCPPCEEQGWLEGYVMDSELADTEPPCTKAVVHIEPGDLDIPADPLTGYYGPVQLISYTYTLKASAPGFSVETAVVDVTTGMTTTQDFDLWRPVIDVEPANFISITAIISRETTYPLTITNDGHLPLDFRIREIPPGSLLSVAAPRSYQQMPAAVGVDSFIYEQFAVSPDGRADFFIAFKDTADLTPAYHMNWSDRGRFVVKVLQAAADAAQGRVKAWLDEQGIEYTSYWINNTLFVHADETTLNALAAFPEVSGLMGNHTYQVMPVEGEEDPQNEILTPQYPWNITFPGADQVHADFIRGEGIVIGGMDTGVEYDHIGLVNNYRGNLGGGSFDHIYSWFDPGTNNCGSNPCDTDGHGTATHGIMTGDDDPSLPDGAWIGMAPDAQWIHCLGLPYGSGSTAELLQCALWFLAPGGDPDMRPHVVNHSWGSWVPNYCSGNWYAPALQAYRAADIFPAFAAGNVGDWVSPPHCWSSTSPANNTDPHGNPLAFASGAHGADGSLDYYSSGGPSACNNDNLFPDLVASGLDSCTTGLNDTYNCSFGGTSSASPHTAGCAALVRQAAPWLTVEEVEQVLRDAADDVNDGCGTPSESPDWNNKYGEGHLDCYEAVQSVQYDPPWVWEDPTSGTIPGPGEIEISVTFHCTETHDYTGALRILHNDPCEGPVDVPIVLHCQEPLPEPTWDKQVSVNGVPTDTTPITVVPSDTIEIVDRVWITYSAGITFTLMETWTESLDLTGWISDTGSATQVGRTLTWDVTDAAPNTWYAITKTFHVEESAWLYDYITETLWVENADPQPGDRLLQFNYLSSCVDVTGADFVFAPAAPLVGQTVTFTGTVAAGTSPITYAWDFGDGSAAQVGNPITHAFPLTSTKQTYTVTLTAANACPSQGTASKAVTVSRRVYLPIIMKNAAP